jgi:hypothetical protein
MGVHCVVHRINLVVQSLFNFILIAHIEAFMVNHRTISVIHEMMFRFQKLVIIMEMKGNKTIKCWDPLDINVGAPKVDFG